MGGLGGGGGGGAGRVAVQGAVMFDMRVFDNNNTTDGGGWGERVGGKDAHACANSPSKWDGGEERESGVCGRLP